MKYINRYPDYNECYEYHGNTTIERILKKGNTTVRRDWLLFDSVEEALDYYNNTCSL